MSDSEWVGILGASSSRPAPAGPLAAGPSDGWDAGRSAASTAAAVCWYLRRVCWSQGDNPVMVAAVILALLDISHSCTYLRLRKVVSATPLAEILSGQPNIAS